MGKKKAKDRGNGRQSVVVFEKTGRTADAEFEAVLAWADSTKCNFQRGASLGILVGSIKGAELQLSSRALGRYLSSLAGSHSTRFKRENDQWQCAPKLSHRGRLRLLRRRLLIPHRRLCLPLRRLHLRRQNHPRARVPDRANWTPAAQQASSRRTKTRGAPLGDPSRIKDGPNNLKTPSAIVSPMRRRPEGLPCPRRRRRLNRRRRSN